MNHKILEQFWEIVNGQEMALLATCASNSVTMRTVSPVSYEGKILMFTDADSTKYRQLKENPQCCLQISGFFIEATAAFLGATMLKENEPLRQAYDKKFNGAFDEGLEHGGREAEFILFTPKKITGWAYDNDSLSGEGIPTTPFEIKL